ncbi:hypothetical protein POX_f07370 [Penicillium oxalicum]|nr:hypothetical protein POX_f07370 [Penicillium oxalicum]KAI2787017.1 hypothetical protein POX_f07370 [Penicillium oxalicum]
MLVNHSEQGSGSISDALADRICLRQFELSGKRLYSTLELLRSY